MLGFTALSEEPISDITPWQTVVALAGVAGHGIARAPVPFDTVQVGGVASPGLTGFAIPGITQALAQAVGRSRLGTVDVSDTVALSQVVAGGLVGVLSPYAYTILLSGVRANGRVGALELAATVGLTGMSASGLAHLIGLDALMLSGDFAVFLALVSERAVDEAGSGDGAVSSAPFDDANLVLAFAGDRAVDVPAVEDIPTGAVCEDFPLVTAVAGDEAAP
jgi:hypothetical protein